VKAEAICASCVLHDLVGALDRLAIDGEVRGRVLRLALRQLADTFDLQQPPSTHITAVHRILKREAGIALPFAALRARCNEVGLEVAAQVGREAAALGPEERFRFLVRWAIAGNHLDFRTVGTGYDFPPERITAMLRQSLDAGLAVDETAALRAALRPGARVVYVHDNVGEIALDALLIAAVRAAGAHVTSALRGGPITSDATLEDGAAVGLEQVADAIVCAGPDTLGISWAEMSPELRAALQSADVVIAKGQANYYVLSEHRGALPGQVACLLRTKCPTVSRRFGHEQPINVAVLLPLSP
jgi:damage-control phosphatase, subfamily I